MTKWQLKTSVVLIIFNRPDTTERVFQVIRQVKPPQLFIIADAPRLDKLGEVEKCMAARKIIDRVDWQCEILTNYSEINLGCRERIYSGLNWVFSLVESAIILEDDCVPNLTFFRFCQELLERYQDNNQVMAISGDNFQFGNNPTKYSYYFSRYPHCWGWATWRRAWKNYDNRMQLWSQLRDSKWLENILQNSHADQYWSEIFQNNYQGFNSWAYAWTFACWNHHGLTILPKVNLVSNIGFGQGATHTSSINRFANMSVEEMIFPLSHPPSIIRNIPADDFTEKTMFSGSLQLQNVRCQVCGSISHKFDTAKVLNKYNVDYFQCSNCGFVQTENPYWLGEAYRSAIAGSDVGLVSRNQNFSLITENLILNFFNVDGKFLDYGCGYGLFVRMMRDLGLDFYGYDKYCQNIFYQGWEGEINSSQKYEIITAFEVFEHFINPLAEIEKILQQTRNILFSTKLLPSDNPRPNDWWYYALEEGQHISIYTTKALSLIAQKFQLNLYSDGESLHLLTEQKLSNSQFQTIFRVGRYKPDKRKEPLTQLDHEKVTEKIKSSQDKLNLKIVIDAVFFQINNTGIARVWKSLLEVWSKDSFGKNILVLDRAKTAPKIPGIKYRVVPGYNYGRIDADRQMLQKICDEENADIFISTYYTTPILTPSIFMAYDMIPEILGKSLNSPSWQEKHRSIKQAISYIAISENTARDLVKYFPQISANSIRVAPCGIEPKFSIATPEAVTNFRLKYHINQPYFLIVGERIGWLGYKNTILFFQAFAKLKKSRELEIVCIGGNRKLEPDLSKYISGSKINLLKLSDEELKLAYSGAIALVYPSKHEGFGLPILEAMACGCPVITCKNSSIPEVAGRAALYIDDNDINGLINALGEVQKSEVRQQLITAGLAQVQKFSWSQMAKIMSDVFIQNFNQIKLTQSNNIIQSIDHQNMDDSSLTKIQGKFPEIAPISGDCQRPFFSVMIPTYKKVKYLEQTLKSVLQQAPAPEEMQIEVVNDCPDHKIQAEIEAIVRKVGGERVDFYRHFPQDIGQAPIFNICLERAKGYWVHLLHDDDFVLPGFYEKLRRGIEQNTTVGAAFCRHYYIDEYDQKKYLSVLERKTPGIIENFLEKITIEQRIQVVGMVVKRKVYENLGGFYSQADSAADWEIWKRITAFYPIWFEPEILACFRLHSSSETSRLMQSGGNIENARKAIEITQTYLPKNMAENLSNQAREHYAIEAIKMAASMLRGGNTNGAIAQIREGLKCSQSPSVVNLLISVLVSGETDLIKAENQPVNSPKPQSIEQQKVPPTVETNLLPSLTEINQKIKLYQQNQLDESALVALQEIRKKIAECWLNIKTSEELKNVYLGELSKAHKVLLASGIKDETLTKIEQIFVDQIKANIAKGFNQPLAIQYLLAGMLYQRADRLRIKYEKAPIPSWFATDYLKFMFASPQLFQEIGEADNYHHFLAGWLNYVHNNISTNPDSELWQAIAWFFVQNANWIPLYFTTTPNLKNLYIKRAEIVEFALKNRGLELDYQMSNRPFDRKKIRLGILKDHYFPQTETYSLLPVFEYLDRSKFEIFLYAIKSNGDPLEKYCQSHADKFLQLPEELKSQAQIIRNDDLDILFIGSNITATIKNSTLLAIHKLARIQITSINSPTTTGMRSIDYYISGKITAPTETTQEHYTEKLANLEGSGLCFRYAIADPPPGVKPIRSSWGATDETTIFISGANFYKIIPEMRETWAKILAKVSNSILVLYPFNPNWTNSYRVAPFLEQMRSVLKGHGIDSKRLVVIRALPSKADIKECLKLADIYLDSFPYGGATSLVDPLMIGVPPVVVEGNALRFRQASALLREMKMDDLIADGEESYINLAVKLATNHQLRQQKRQEILEKIEQNPSFLDSRTYSTQIGKLFQKLFQEWQNIHAPKTIESIVEEGRRKKEEGRGKKEEGTQTLTNFQDRVDDGVLNPKEKDESSLTSEFINRLIGCVNLYQIDPTDQSLIEELRQIRKQIADFWLAIAPKELENIYQGKVREAYQTLLASGIQNEPQTEDEQKFLKELAETSMGLTNPKAINSLLGAMLYFPPSKMLVRDAKNRLPQWLIEDYKQIFESREVAEKLEKTFKSKSPHLPENYSVITAEVRPEKNIVLTANQTDELDITQQKFINQLLGSVNLYYIDPSDESVVQELRQIRKQVADFWINLEPQKLETFYLGKMGKAYQALLSSGIQNQVLTNNEQAFLQQLATQLAKGIEAPKAINYLLATILYCRQGQLQIQDMSKLPNWLLEDYQKFAGNP